jgi:hypothetical protein
MLAITYYSCSFSNGQYGVSFVGNDGFAGTTGSSFNNVGNPVAQLDFLMKNKKCHLTRWFEIRL